MRNIIILMFLVLVLVSCKENGGTETGNPFESSEVMSSSRAYKIVEAACTKVVGCLAGGEEQEEIQNCISEQMLLRVYSDKLGLPIEYQNSSLLEIIYAEYEKDIASEETAKIRCINEMQNLNCTDVAKSYDLVFEVLQPSCTEVF